MQTAWPPGGPKPENHQAPFQRRLGSLGQPSTGTWSHPPENLFGFFLQQQKNMYPDGSRQKLCGQEGPEKGPTYGHCKGKGEKLKKEKKVRYGE